MSTDLYFLPVVPAERRSLSRALKYIIAPTFFGHDGSLSGHAVLDSGALLFLRGVLAGTRDPAVVESVQLLIAAIEQHEHVELWLEG